MPRLWCETTPRIAPAVRAMKPDKTLRLINLRARLDIWTVREKSCRAEINHMRRGLAEISKERKAAYLAWKQESKRLTGK